jgi:EmrB/QacA subfamily drug resistance transporter
LPSIERDLGFAPENLQWVITAYALTFGGFLLLGGRAADLLGRRLVFMVGLALFTAASLVCGLSQSDEMLIAARAVQGLGAAIVSPAALSIISVTFTEGSERNKALGAWGAVGGSGAAAGVLLGGILTKYLGWEWIFFVNIPVGIVVLALATRFVSESRQEDAVHEYDVLGALSVTSGLVLLVYAISEAPDVGWGTLRTIGLLVVSGVLLLFFVWWESRERAPLMPLGIFRNRMLTAANVVSVLQSGGIYGSFLLLTLYMQQVLGLSVLQTGVGFLATAGTAVVLAALAQALVTRFGAKLVTLIGISFLTFGALWYTQIDVDGSYPVDLLPGFLAVGIGIPFSYIPLTIAALAGVADRESGLAAGMLNTAQQVGGAIGVAVISTVAFTHVDTLIAEGNPPPVALTGGFQWGFWVTAGIWGTALIAAAVLIRRMEIPAGDEAPSPASP